ncbi:hypothetical protein CWE13_10430 [Aliidiomarina shirensis]|uniref:Uncharacterized protein n=1 Tax=Aliidiomarina shirensis TaxID=1048642 RepID=A0A432WQ88_9GAMM|nr:hypothetical protein [Aliidiomarina shirensis]RUO35954.1 hypothetical protein CWE13_10430 [Aliidiomarina shirensis]
MFKKSAVYVAVSVLMGLNYSSPVASDNENFYQFLNGVSWGTTAQGRDQCDTSSGVGCNTVP